MTITTIAWPPLYKIKRHRRAKYVKLRASKPHGLEITVPYRFNLRDIPSILEEHKSWITKQLTKLEVQVSDVLPEQIHLAGVNERWQVHYVESAAKLQIIERPHQEIVLLGNVQDQQMCKEKLCQWVRMLAVDRLTLWLQKKSVETGLEFDRVVVRDQRTLWGSCTKERSISLNYKLIFLPAHLVEHVLIHELCHTKYMNHSVRFWELVARFDAGCEVNRRALKKADHYLPDWIL